MSKSGTDAKVSYSFPVIGNSTVDARLAARLNELRVKVAWIDAVIKSAVTQQIKGFNLFRDAVTATDNLLLTYQLALNENIVAAEVFTSLRDLYPNESLNALDSFDAVVSFALSVVDSVIAGDSLTTMSRSANMEDALAATDELAMALGTSVSEVLGASDVLAKTFAPATTTESLTSSEALAMAISWQRLFADAATVSDNLSINAGTALDWSFTENITPAEVLALAIAVTQSSAAAAADGAALNYGQPNQETVGVTDSIGLGIGLKAQDTLGPIDGGTILMENYANDYFAELYVGLTRTIT